MVKKKKEKKKKFILRKVVVKKILRPSKATLVIKQHEPAEYRPIYFKQEMEDAKKSMFFS